MAVQRSGNVKHQVVSLLLLSFGSLFCMQKGKESNIHFFKEIYSVKLTFTTFLLGNTLQ